MTPPPASLPPPSRRRALPGVLLQRGVVGVLTLLLVAGLLYFHQSRNFVPGQLTSDEMDWVQAARNVGAKRTLATGIIRPLLLRYEPASPDGTLPDLAHAPLYPVTAGVAMKLARHTTFGLGDRVAVLLSLGFLAASAGACYLMARRLFGSRGAVLSVLLYVFGANALTTALSPNPITLAATLFTLLVIALAALDVRGVEEQERGKRAGILWAIAAGLLYGLLFLTAYSTLALLPVLFLYVLYVSRRDARAAILFLIAFLLVCAPLFLRNWRIAHNPILNTRLLELMMLTERYPGYGLYRSVGLPESMPQFLSTGGVGEIIRKTGRHLLDYFRQAPQTLGILLLPLFLGAALTRFTDGRVNRLRALVYVLIFWHAVGLAMFLPASEGAPLLLMYLPFAAALGASFLVNIVRARNMPRFHARAVIALWAAAACIPGITQLLFARRQIPAPYNVYYHLNTDSPQGQAVRQSGNLLLVSESPWEIAFRSGLPAVWLPNTGADMHAVEEAMRMPIAGVILTPGLEYGYMGDADALPWWLTYKRVLSMVLLTPSLSRETREQVIAQVSLSYPQEIADPMSDFTPQPFSEMEGSRYTILFWNPTRLP